MSFNAMAWASKQSTGSPTKKLILLMLADRANDEGYCFPSIDTIASDCELGTTAIKTNIKKLADAGFLRIERRKDGGAFMRNVYHLAVNCSDVSAQRGVGREVSMEPETPRDGVGRQVSMGRSPGVHGQGREVSTNQSVSNQSKEPANIFVPAAANETEQELTPPPKAPRPAKALQDVIDSFAPSKERREAIDLWLKYKSERRQSYKPTGLSTLLNKWRGISDAEFAEAVEFSVSSNYSGLFAPKKSKSSGRSWETTL